MRSERIFNTRKLKSFVYQLPSLIILQEVCYHFRRIHEDIVQPVSMRSQKMSHLLVVRTVAYDTVSHFLIRHLLLT